MALFCITILNFDTMNWYLAGYFFIGSYQIARSLVVAQGKVLVKETNIGLAYGIFETVGGIVAVFGAPIAGLLFNTKPTSPYLISLYGIGISILLSVFFIPVRANEIN